MEEKLVEDSIEDLKNNFVELVVTRVKKHTFFWYEYKYNRRQKG